MSIRAISLENIPETAYLGTDNTPRYRAIMRTFYLESEKMHYQLDKQEIFAFLQAEQQLYDYTFDQLEQDLNALCAWRNLVPIQDPRKPATIEEYKNKQYRYFMSPAAVEVERMTIAIEELNLQTTVQSAQLFLHILNKANELQTLDMNDSTALLAWWDDLQQDFTQLTQNYQDYLRDFYSSHAEHILRTQEFLLHKDQVLHYLRDFVLELQRHSEKIRNHLLKVQPEKIHKLLEGVLAAQLEAGQGRLIERGENYEQELEKRIYGRWDTFYRWFVPVAGGQSESQRVMAVTNDIIQRILMNAELLIQAHSGGANRKSEYKKFLELFAQCATLEDAHILSAMVFGAQTTYHLSGIAAEETYTAASCYDEPPFLYPLRNRQRPGRAPRVKNLFEDKSMVKAAQRAEYLHQKEEERKRLQHFIDKGHLDFSLLAETVTPDVRRSFLGWITAANASESKTARTEYGQRYILKRQPGKTCVLHCTDGDLTMPAYCLDFETEISHG